MKPFEFIDFAQHLAVQPATTPALLRSITSRAYYGAFHLAKALIANLGAPPTAKHDAHVWLLASHSEDAHQAGRLLADLNNARIKADYQLEDALAETINFARRSVERAVEVRILLQKCAALPPTEVLARRTL
jgi:uncharacterized protein (UPF0332 family)